jgi:hypothetical protein
VQSSLVDVSVDAAIIADGSGGASGTGAHTSFSFPSYSAPGYSFDGSGNITAFAGKFEWKGTIDIQTVYGSSASASDLSCYGRGTTTSDVQSRDITLGFHENRHQVDYENYLSSHALPDPPNMSIGMARTAYEAEKTRFQQEYTAYRNAMEQDSETRTDEVGHTRSSWQQSGTCYVHQVP